MMFCIYIYVQEGGLGDQVMKMMHLRSQIDVDTHTLQLGLLCGPFVVTPF